jgi:hypothetical protein
MFQNTVLVVASLVAAAVGSAWIAPENKLLAVDGPQVQNVEPMVVEGTVVSASAGQVSLRAADGKEHSFKPNEMTRITVNGKPGKLDDLKAGTMIRVMVDKQGKVISISTVDDRK